MFNHWIEPKLGPSFRLANSFYRAQELKNLTW